MFTDRLVSYVSHSIPIYNKIRLVVTEMWIKGCEHVVDWGHLSYELGADWHARRVIRPFQLDYTESFAGIMSSAFLYMPPN